MSMRTVVAVSLALTFLLPPVSTLPWAAQDAAAVPAAPAAGSPLPAGADKVLLRTLADGLSGLGDGARQAPLDLRSRLPAHVQAALHPDLARAGPGAATTYAAGTTTTLTGAITVSDDWNILGTVNIHDAVVTFTGNQVIKVADSGTLTIDGATTLQDQDSNPDTGGVISATGNLTIQGTSSAPVLLKSTTAIGYSKAAGAYAGLNVTWTRFTGVNVGLITDNSRATIANDTFDNDDIGVLFDVDQHGGANAAVTVTNSRFVGNLAGAVFNADVNGVTDPAGTLKNSEFTANAYGVLCESQGENGQPHIDHNNFDYDFLEGYSGVQGVSVPGVGTVIVQSTCTADSDFFGNDTRYPSTTDTVSNVRASRWTDFTVPPNPLTVTVVSDQRSLALPAKLDGPLVVTKGGNLSIKNGTLDANNQLWGSGPGGSLQTDRLTVTRNGLVLDRNDADAIFNVTTSGKTNWDDVLVGAIPSPSGGSFHVWQYRNSGTIFGWNVSGAEGVYMGTSGLAAETTTYTPTVKNFVVTGSGSMGGVLGSTFQVSFAKNTYRMNNLVFFPVLATFSSTDEVYESNNIGIESELSATTMSNALFASNNIAAVSAVDTSFTATGAFDYNAYGMISFSSTVKVTNSNFRDNYQQSLITIQINVAGAAVAASLTCANCFFYRADDKSYDANAGGTISVTEALQENAGPAPSWLGDVVIADGAGTTKTLSGTLKAPAIARGGGTLQVDGASLSGDNRRFPIGGKTGGVAAGPVGHVVVRNATLDSVRFISVNETGTGSIIENSVIKNSNTQFEMFYGATTVRCNQLDGLGIVVRWIRQQGNGNKLVFDRNLVTRSFDVRLGLGNTENQAADVTDNGYADSSSVRGLVWRIHNGTVRFNGNDLLAKRGLFDGATTANEPSVQRIDATGNWWNSSAGPTFIDNGTTKATGGAILEHSGKSAPPDYSGYATARNAIAPCAGFSLSPAAPTEVDSVTFRDTAFAPDGSGLQSRTYDFGDGTPAVTLTDPAVTTTTHQFADGGTFTVKLTATSNSGKSTTSTRSVAVSNVPPVANFTASVVDELSNVTFTDTSTHPNPNDAPPAGWTYSWAFGNEGSSSERNPSFKFADGGSKTVKLTVTDNDGQSDTVTKTINIPHVPPVANFTWTGTNETDTFAFADKSSAPNPNDKLTAWAWSCSDGFASSAQNPSHKFPDGGSYACTLKVTDDDNQTASATRSVAVSNVPPSAGFTTSFTDEASAVRFTDASTHPNPNDAPPAGWTYRWDFNGEGKSSERSPSFKFANGGSKNVTLTVTDNDGLSSSVTHAFSLPDVAPVAAFSFSPSVPNPGDAVQFTDASTHPNAPSDRIVAWSWDFGDGGSSTAQSPSHVFAQRGAYNVTLTVTDGDGLTGSVLRRVAVGNIPPVASFDFTPASPTDLDAVRFTDNSSDADGSVANWSWSFSDGFTSTERNVTHQFADNGSYAVTLTVTDNLGATGTLTRTVEVRNVPPVASFTVQPANPQVNDVVHFYDGSSDADGKVVKWSWDLGDGTTSAEPSPSHAYAAGGDYKVTLVVTDNDGATSTATQNVHVCETHITPDLNKPEVEVCLKVHVDDPVRIVYGTIRQLESLVNDLTGL